jgi:hypothetical protein
MKDVQKLLETMSIMAIKGLRGPKKAKRGPKEDKKRTKRGQKEEKKRTKRGPNEGQKRTK